MQNKGFRGMLGINILVILVFGLYFFGKRSYPEMVAPKNLDSLQQQIIDGASKTTDIVVQIIAEDTSTYYQEGNFDKNSLLEQKNILKKGSGIIASKQGYIITNNHVVDNQNLKYSVITSDGSILSVKKIRKDDLIDIAILLVDTTNFLLSAEARFVDIDTPISLGQFVFAIGNPLSEYPNTLSLGIISGKGRKVFIEDSKTTYYAGLYQTDAALNPGNSGGPLITLSSEVIGMVTAISRGGNNIGFALPLTQDFISTTLDLLKQHTVLLRPYLGITYTDTATGAKIDTIFAGSPVQGQLMVGDIIVALDKRELSFNTPLLYYLYTYKPGETIILTVKRNDDIFTVSVVLGQKTL